MNVKLIVAILVVLLGGAAALLGIRGIPEPERRAGDATPSGSEQAEQAAPAADSAIAEKPSFELVRVEPSGELVAAGRATAETSVELVSEETVLGTASTNASGEWAMVLGQPLGVGSHDLALRAKQKAEATPVYGDRVAVVISEDGETPLVAVTPDGAPSRVVQQPDETRDEAGEDAAREVAETAGDEPAPQEDGSTRLAMTDDRDTDEPRTGVAAEGESSGDEKPGNEKGAEAKPGIDDAENEPGAVAGSGTNPDDARPSARETASEAASGASDAAGRDDAAPEDEGTARVAEEADAGGSETAEDAPEETLAEAAPAGSETRTGQQEQGTPPLAAADRGEPRPDSSGAPDEAMPDAAATRDDTAPETDATSDASRMASSDEDAPAGAEVTAAPNETSPDATGEASRSAASDQGDAGGRVVSAVPDEVADQEEASDAGPGVAKEDAAGRLAAADPATQPGDAAGGPQTAPDATGDQRETADEVSADATPGGTGEEQAAPPPVTGDGEVSIETVEVSEPDQLMLSGESEPDQAVRIYVNNEPLAEVEADASGRWTVQAAQSMPPGNYEVRVDAVSASGSVVARSAVEFDRVRVAFADEGGEGTGSGIAASGTGEGGAGDAAMVHINRGDNLWTIARKLYGKGLRYTVIYDANRNQIRNPDLIYPGQVFTIPRSEQEDADGSSEG